MILIQFLICGHTARAVCGLKFERMIRRVKETNPSYRASGMWIEIALALYFLKEGYVIPRERYVD